MIKSNNYLRALVGFCLILLQVSNSWCQDLSSSVVKIYSGDKYLCAGTLVKDSYVVTSAECLAGGESSLTVVGNINYNEATPADESSVIGIFKHPNYNKGKKHLNVAVLKLNNSIAGLKIKSAELCNKTNIEAEEPLTMYFWDLRPKVTRIRSVNFNLRTLNLSVKNKDNCAKLYNSKISDTVLCAAGSNRNYFFYDSGGPATIDGQFCGIFLHGDKALKKISVPGTLTSLANPEVMQFINDSLEN